MAILSTFRRPLPVPHLAIRHSPAPVPEGTATPERRWAFRISALLAKYNALHARPIAPRRRPKMPDGFAER